MKFFKPPQKDSTPLGKNWQTLGNYRILKELSSTDRARLYLAQSFSGDIGFRARQSLSWPTSLNEHNQVVLKVYGSQVPEARIAAEAEILDAVRGPGVVELRDVMVLPDGPRALVLEALSGQSLAKLWEETGRLSLGQAVTILAPLAVTLGRLAEADVVHGSVWAGNLVLASDGRLVLTSFGAARRHAQPSIDWHDFAALIKSCAHLLDSGPNELMSLASDLEQRLAAGFQSSLAVEIEAKLFRLADPESLKTSVESSDFIKEPLAEPRPERDKKKARFGFWPTKLRRPIFVFGGLATALVLLLFLVIPAPDSGAKNESVNATSSQKPEVLEGKNPVESEPKSANKPPLGPELSELLRRCIEELDPTCNDAVNEVVAGHGG